MFGSGRSTMVGGWMDGWNNRIRCESEIIENLAECLERKEGRKKERKKEREVQDGRVYCIGVRK